MFVLLNKSPRENGRSLGKAGKTVLKNRISYTKKAKKAAGFSDKLIRERIQIFKDLVMGVSPHWLEEVKGMAQGSGVHPDDILMLNCPPQNLFPEISYSCTSYVKVGRRENQLFKIRDERNHVQTFYVNAARGFPRFHTGQDIGNIGTAHFLNEHFLSGGCNSGSRTLQVPAQVLLNDCHILRFFAENARSTDDIPRLFETLIQKKAAGGAGENRGAIYLFVDPDKGLILETTSFDYQATWIKKGLKVVSNHYLSPKTRSWESVPADKNTLLRKTRMESMLSGLKDNPNLKEVFALSRDRKNLPHALCNDDSKHPWMTLSAQLHLIPRKSPEKSINYFCCGNTRHSLYLPQRLEDSESFSPLLSGSFYQLTDRMYCLENCSRHLAFLQGRFEGRMLQKDQDKGLFREAYKLVKNALESRLKQSQHRPASL